MTSRVVLVCLLAAIASSTLRVEVTADQSQVFNNFFAGIFRQALQPAISSDVYDGCGVSKSCIATPDDCIDSKSCSMMATYKTVENLLEMEIYGQVSDDEYVAVGFSADEKMGKDSVTECVKYKTSPGVFQSFNKPGDDDNARLASNLPGFAVNSTSYVDGYVYCHFYHPIVFTNTGEKFDLNQSYYLLMATGPAASTNIKEHHENECSSSTLSFLTDTPVITYFKESRVLKQIHGIFMVIAWLMAASIGILLPRHMKRTWVGKQIFGKDRWFIYHQALMGLAWTLTVIAFIIIFIDVDGWISESVSENPHPLLGCITTVLAFIQPFMAALRPAPDAANRYIFNWAHLLVGHSAHILAITTIFLAVEMEEAELRYETYWILTTHICVYAIAQCALNFLAFKKPNVSDSLKEDIANRDQQGSFLRKVIIGAYACIVVCLGITVIVFIAVEK